MLKSKLNDFIDNITFLLAAIIVVLLILSLTTDIRVSSDLLSIVNAIIFALVGFKTIESRKYLGYFCFVPAIVMIISMIITGLYLVFN